MRNMLFNILSVMMLFSGALAFASDDSEQDNEVMSGRCCRLIRGATGVTGAPGIGVTGATGVTGLPGATGATGVLPVTSFAYIYNTFSGTVTPSGDSLLKGGISSFGPDYAFNPFSGDITINTAGLYEVIYGASATTTTEIGVAVNGVFAAQSPPIVVDGVSSQGMVTTSFITTFNAGDVLRFRSSIGIDLYSINGTASAFIQFIKLQ